MQVTKLGLNLIMWTKETGGNRKVLPVLNQVIRLMKLNKKPINGTELMIQALRQWQQGSRSRQISRRELFKEK